MRTAELPVVGVGLLPVTETGLRDRPVSQSPRLVSVFLILLWCFSSSLPLAAQPHVPSVGAATPAQGSGLAQTFVYTFSDPAGFQDLDVVNILVNRFLDGRQACYLAYSQPANVLFLVNDAGDGLLPALSLGSGGSVANSQCAVAGTGSSAVKSGNTLTLTLNLTFTPAFAGNRVVYLAARDQQVPVGNSGWQAVGVWTVPGAPVTSPSVVSLSPGRASGATTQFAFTFSDAQGWQDLGVVNVLVNQFLDGRQGCYLAYSRPLGVLYLVNDVGDGLLPGVALNSPGTLYNSHCGVDTAASSASGSGNTLTLTLTITFYASFPGNRVIYLAARDVAENNSGWQALGTYNIVSSVPPPPLDLVAPVLTVTPADGAVVTTTSPLIQIDFNDAGWGLDLYTFTVSIDGVDFTSRFTVTPTRASYQATLTGGQHVIVASIRDRASNRTQVTSRFTVSSFRALPDAYPRSGPAPLTVTFVSRAEYTEGTIRRYRWDFEGDGIFDTDDPGAISYTRTFTTAGTRNAVLEVVNDRNQTASATVQINVGGAPPVATGSVNPSNGPVPLLVYFYGSGYDPDGTIAKYEWDFQGDGVYDFTSASSGNTSYTYSQQGTYNAVLRVTDNQGLTATASSAATSVRVGPAGSPIATITSPASPLTRTAPAAVSFYGTGSDPGGSITKYEWDFDGNGTYDYSSATTASTSYTYLAPGVYTVAFRVTDNSGNTGVDTVTVTIELDVDGGLSTDTIHTAQGERVDVNLTLSGRIAMTLYFKNKAGQRVRTLVNNVVRNAGSYTDTWDGKDDAGVIVPEGVYYGVLQYVTATGETITLDGTDFSGGDMVFPDVRLYTAAKECTFYDYSCTFQPLQNDQLKIEFYLQQACEVTATIRLYNDVSEVITLFEKRPFGRQTYYTAFWDGADSTGRMVAAPPGDSLLVAMMAFTLPDNAVFVENAPQVSNVSVTPNYFDPSTGDFLSPQNPTARVGYTLSKTATVTLQVYQSGSNRLLRTISQSGAAAGSRTIEWDGRNESGVFVDKGDYRLALRAVDASGSQSIVRYLPVRVFY